MYVRIALLFHSLLVASSADTMASLQSFIFPFGGEYANFPLTLLLVMCIPLQNPNIF